MAVCETTHGPHNQTNRAREMDPVAHSLPFGHVDHEWDPEMVIINTTRSPVVLLGNRSRTQFVVDPHPAFAPRQLDEGYDVTVIFDCGIRLRRRQEDPTTLDTDMKGALERIRQDACGRALVIIIEESLYDEWENESNQFIFDKFLMGPDVDPPRGVLRFLPIFAFAHSDGYLVSDRKP